MGHLDRLKFPSLTLIIIGQTVVMAFPWCFTGYILLVDVLTLPDHIVHLIVKYPTELTMIVTLISTVLSIITSWLFKSAVNRASQHYFSELRSITLFELRTAAALSTAPTWVWPRRDFLPLSVGALTVFAVVTLLHSSWSTLLLPTVVQWPVRMTGTELDLGSVAFGNQLSTDLNEYYANGVQAPAFETLNILSLVSGLAAVDIEGGVPTSSMFSFNGVSYDQSTGGILPAIEEYSGSLNPTGSAVGLAFSGGKVPVHTSPEWGHLGRDAGTHQGISKNYTVTQQSVTANVTCQPMDRSQNSFTAVNSTTQGPLNTFITWNATANCTGNSNSQIFFTAGKMNGQVDIGSEGFLPIVVCPNPNVTTTFTPNKFYIFMAGEYKYDFLPTTVCEVVPYLTTVNVTYNGGIISVDRNGTSPELTSSPNLPLSLYIATVMAYQAGANQGMTSNPIGDFLTAYGNNNVSVMYSELVTVSAPLISTPLIGLQEDYWRGVAEFASTQLRSGYTASGVPSNMARSTNGTMYIITYGWRSKAYTYIYLLALITLVWGTTILAARYSFMKEKANTSDPSFDPFFNLSDPADLIIATSESVGDRHKIDDITVGFVSATNLVLKAEPCSERN
ncbi:hypothetical protein BDR04DRAFT_1145535 [Suillus decipiens]|nr:hypothetical protein BDR04DRAFT_1145535 [Suillus decipiens]